MELAPARAASSGMIARPENMSSTTGALPSYVAMIFAASLRIDSWSPSRTAASISVLNAGSSGKSDVSAAARAWAMGRDANQVKIAFSTRPDPVGVPQASSTAATGNHRSIIRVSGFSLTIALSVPSTARV